MTIGKRAKAPQGLTLAFLETGLPFRCCGRSGFDPYRDRQGQVTAYRCRFCERLYDAKYIAPTLPTSNA